MDQVALITCPFHSAKKKMFAGQSQCQEAQLQLLSFQTEKYSLHQLILEKKNSLHWLMTSSPEKDYGVMLSEPDSNRMTVPITRAPLPSAMVSTSCSFTAQVTWPSIIMKVNFNGKKIFRTNLVNFISYGLFRPVQYFTTAK